MTNTPGKSGIPSRQETAASGEGGRLTWRAPTWPSVRDGILFFCGLAGIAYETIWRRPPDYGLLPVFATMAGLPWFIKQDKHHDEDD